MSDHPSEFKTLFPFLKSGMKPSTALSKMTAIPRMENLNKLTEEEKETYLKLKEKVVELNPVEIEYSKLFENRYVKGNIAISIDPVDYLLMSVNKSGWNSCYRLTNSSFGSREFGQYSSGTLCYLCDSSTMIAYRHGENMVEYKIGSSKFKEYSKNWRQVIYVDTATWGFACSRQYPFTDGTLTRNVREFLEDTLSNYLSVPNSWRFKEITNEDKLRKMIIKKPNTNKKCLSYNDILCNNRGFFVSNPTLSKISNTRFFVDSDPVCPICGVNHLDSASTPVCRDCRSKEGF